MEPDDCVDPGETGYSSVRQASSRRAPKPRPHTQAPDGWLASDSPTRAIERSRHNAVPFLSPAGWPSWSRDYRIESVLGRAMDPLHPMLSAIRCNPDPAASGRIRHSFRAIPMDYRNITLVSGFPRSLVLPGGTTSYEIASREADSRKQDGTQEVFAVTEAGRMRRDRPEEQSTNQGRRIPLDRTAPTRRLDGPLPRRSPPTTSMPIQRVSSDGRA